MHPGCVSEAMMLFWKGGESFEPLFHIVSSLLSDLHCYFFSSHNQILPKEIVYQPNQLSHLGFSRHERTCERESQPRFFFLGASEASRLYLRSVTEGVRQWVGGRGQRFMRHGPKVRRSSDAAAAACEDLTTDFARIVSREHRSHQNRGPESRAVHVRTHGSQSPATLRLPVNKGGTAAGL